MAGKAWWPRFSESCLQGEMMAQPRRRNSAQVLLLRQHADPRCAPILRDAFCFRGILVNKIMLFLHAAADEFSPNMTFSSDAHPLSLCFV